MTKSPTVAVPAFTASADMIITTVRPMENTTAWPELSTESDTQVLMAATS